MGEDEDAEPACRLDEAGGGDGLPGGRRVAEAVAADGPRVRALEAVDLLLLDEAGVVVVVGHLLQLRLGCDGAVPVSGPVAVPVLVGRALGGCDQLREHAGERVHLMPAELGAGGRVRRALGEYALEAEHEPVAHLPVGGRGLPPDIHLRERVVEGCAPGGAGAERDGHVFVRLQEGLAEPGSGSRSRRGQALRRVRRQRRDGHCFVHSRSTCRRAAPSEELTLA